MLLSCPFQLLFDRMLNVFDPLFVTSGDKISKSTFDTKIENDMSILRRRLGYDEATSISFEKSKLNNNIKELAYLYGKDVSTVIPIMYEGYTHDQDYYLGNELGDSYISYLVITNKSGTITKESTVENDFSITDSDGKIYGKTEAGTDTTAFSALQATGKLACDRLVNFKLFRNADDDNPIDFDSCYGLIYGYINSGTSYDIVINAGFVSFSLVQQVMGIVINDKTLAPFPIVPSNYNEIMASSQTEILAISSGEISFSPNIIPFKKKVTAGGNDQDVGLFSPLIFLGEPAAGGSGQSVTMKYCHIYSKVYQLWD